MEISIGDIICVLPQDYGYVSYHKISGKVFKIAQIQTLNGKPLCICFTADRAYNLFFNEVILVKNLSKLEYLIWGIDEDTINKSK